MTNPSDFAALWAQPLTKILELIVANRRSVYSYLPKPVPREIIAWAINMAGLAPNHYKTRPWRFSVFADGGREKLADAYQRAALRLGRDVRKARERALTAPIMIVVGCVPQIAHPKVKPHEEELATAAAIQNLMLALSAAEVSSLWTTGELVESEEVRAAAELGAEAKILGVVYAGFRDPHRPLPPRAVTGSSDSGFWHTS